MSRVITDVYVITVDTSESIWIIEGEITFDEELTLVFEATYDSDIDDFEDITIEDGVSDYDVDELKKRILHAVANFE